MTVWQGVWVRELTLADAELPRTFEDYVQTRSASLLRFAYLITRNREDAQDAVQDALAGLYPRWERVASQGNVDAYVRRSIVNANVSAWRKVQRLVPVADLDRYDRPDDTDQVATLADADQALRLCAGLPPIQRAAVVLRFYEDRSFADIGDILGCAEATARSHVHRALVALRQKFKEQSDD